MSMSHELPDTVDKSESLYRVVKRSRQDCLSRNMRATAALFRDPNGVSVDRDAGREENEIVRFIVTKSFPKRAKGVVVVSAEKCIDAQAEVKPAPSEGNPYHANIFMSNNEQVRKIQALKIADGSQLIYFDENMEWVTV